MTLWRKLLTEWTTFIAYGSMPITYCMWTCLRIAMNDFLLFYVNECCIPFSSHALNPSVEGCIGDQRAVSWDTLLQHLDEPIKGGAIITQLNLCKELWEWSIHQLCLSIPFIPKGPLKWAFLSTLVWNTPSIWQPRLPSAAGFILFRKHKKYLKVHHTMADK